MDTAFTYGDAEQQVCAFTCMSTAACRKLTVIRAPRHILCGGCCRLHLRLPGGRQGHPGVGPPPRPNLRHDKDPVLPRRQFRRRWPSALRAVAGEPVIHCTYGLACHICAGTGLTPPNPAPRLGSSYTARSFIGAAAFASPCCSPHVACTCGHAVPCGVRSFTPCHASSVKSHAPALAAVVTFGKCATCIGPPRQPTPRCNR